MHGQADSELDAVAKVLALGGTRRAALWTLCGAAISTALRSRGTAAKSRRKKRRRKNDAERRRKDNAGHTKNNGTALDEIGSLNGRGRSYSTTYGIRAPWALTTDTSMGTWKVYQGYQASSGGFHCSSNSRSQAFAFDLVPETGNAGNRNIYAPVAGTASTFYIGPGRGYGVHIKTSNGYTVALYHLQSLKIGNGSIAANTLIGSVFNAYNYAGTKLNHLHLHVTDGSGNAVPLKIAGRLYSGSATGICTWPGKWAGTKIRENALFKDRNQQGSILRVLSSATGIAGSNYTAWNDSVSSVRVNDGCQITLYQHTNYQGSSATVKPSGASTLPSYIDNQTSSLKLTCS